MRARNIKPGFYRNDALLECSLAARLLFPGLWMMADREGRLEDRPKKLKIELFPGDNLDVDELLAELDKAKLITRYSVDGERYIQVTNFAKHQRPHPKEVASIIPPLHGEPCLGEKSVEPRCDPIRLNPSSLNPESLISESEALPPEVVSEKTKFADTPAGLAQEFCFYSTRTKRGQKSEFPEDVEPFMADLFLAGCKAPQIRQRIHDPTRGKSELAWEFKRDMLAIMKAKPPPIVRNDDERAKRNIEQQKLLE